MKVLLSQNSSFVLNNQKRKKNNLSGIDRNKTDQFISFASTKNQTTNPLKIWPLIGMLAANPMALANNTDTVPSLYEQITKQEISNASVNINKSILGQGRSVNYTFQSPYGEIIMSQEKLFYQHDRKPFVEPKVSIVKVGNKDIIYVEYHNEPGYDSNSLKIDLSRSTNPIIVVKGNNVRVQGSPTSDLVEFKSSGNMNFYDSGAGLDNKDSVFIFSEEEGVPTSNNSGNGANLLVLTKDVTDSSGLNSKIVVNTGNRNIFKNNDITLITGDSYLNTVDGGKNVIIKDANANTVKDANSVSVLDSSGNQIMSSEKVHIGGNSPKNNLVMLYNPSPEPSECSENKPMQDMFSYNLKTSNFDENGNFKYSSLGDIPQVDSGGIGLLKLSSVKLTMSPGAQSAGNTITYLPVDQVLSFNDILAKTSKHSQQAIDHVKSCIDSRIEELKASGNYPGYRQQDFNQCWKDLD